MISKAGRWTLTVNKDIVVIFFIIIMMTKKMERSSGNQQHYICAKAPVVGLGHTLDKEHRCNIRLFKLVK